MNRKFYQWAILLTCSALAACSSWSNQSVLYTKPAVTAEWMGSTGMQLRESIQGSPFTLHQQGSAWVVTAPAAQSFNPDRPAFLLPAVLRPLTKIAKLMEDRPDTAVLILGHTDAASNDRANHTLSTERARSVASIFSLSGMNGSRMTRLGMGSTYNLNAARNAAHNHRVEIIIAPRTHIQDMIAVYRPAHTRLLALSETR